MYIRAKKLTKIKYYSVEDSILIYQDIEDDSIHVDESILSDEYKYYINVGQDVIQYKKNETHYVLIKNKAFEIPAGLCFFDNIIDVAYYNENYNYDKTIKRSRSDLYKFDLATKISTKLLSNTADILTLANKYSLIFFLPKATIKSLSLLTGEYEWEVDLAQYGELRKTIGVSDSKLWLSINSNEDRLKHYLMVLHADNGKILKVIEHNYFFSDFGVLLSEKHQTILSLKGGTSQPSWFYEYDAITGNELRALEVPALKEANFGVKSFTVYGDYIYFTATDGAQIVANTVGVLDYHTLELLWFEKGFPGGLRLDPPQVTEDRLYVLSGKDELYIFERE